MLRPLLPLALLLAAAAPAQPLNLPLAMAERIAASDAVIVARVVKSYARSTSEVLADITARRAKNGSPRNVADLRVPHRAAEVEVTETLKGNGVGKRARVLFAMDGWGFTLKPVTPGANVLLYLRRTGSPGEATVVNEPYGAAAVRPDGTLGDGTTLDEVRKAASPAPPEAKPRKRAGRHARRKAR